MQDGHSSQDQSLDWNSACEIKVYPAGGKHSFVLSMRNGLPYLSKDLFWMAMEDIAKHATLISSQDIHGEN